jgi:hypothetical protein
LREEYRLRVFENRVLREIFGPKWDDVTGERRKFNNEELHILLTQYCAGDNIENDMGEACSADGGGDRRVQGFGWKTLGKETTVETQV